MSAELAGAAELVPYQRLIKLIEAELELAGQGRTRELQEAVQATGEYMKTLQSPAPPQARPLIHRAAALRGRVTIETQRLRERLEVSRASIKRARMVTRTYVPKPRRRYSTSA